MTAPLGQKCRQYAAEREIDETALAYAYARDATRSPLPRVVAPQDCVYVPALFPDGDGAVDVGGQFVFCDSDLARWRGRHRGQAGDIASKRTLSRAERPFADRHGFCVGLDKLPQIGQDAERRGVPVVVVLAEGVSDYLTALSIVSPWQPWQDAAQCAVGAVGVHNMASAAEAAWGAVGGAGAHLVAVAHNDSAKADQGARGAYGAVVRWRSLGGASAWLLLCGDDLSADWRAHRLEVLAALLAVCGERDGFTMSAWPGADTAHVRSVIAASNEAERVKLEALQAQPKSPRYGRRGNSGSVERRPFATFEDVAAALAGWGAVSDGAGGFRAKCPAHRGTKRSLSLRRGDDDKPLLFCHSRQCDYEAILRSLNLWAGAA